MADRKLKGVAGGVAAAADVDPTLVRLLFAIAAFSGWGIVAYIVLAVILSDETAEDPVRPLPREQRRFLRIGLLIAALAAVGRLFDGWFLGGGSGIGLPFVLIAAGAAVLWARRDSYPNAWPPEPPPGTAPDGAPPWPDPEGPVTPAPPWPVAPS
ncbi:MAG: PspC domain-containing protein, partial [Acidimicrobiales bacterium]